MGLWQAVKSMSNQAINAWMKSSRRQSRVKGEVKARSATVPVYRSSVRTAVGSVTTARISTVSTRGSVRAVALRGE
jgi:cystathionine beta-lyase family protein involved in aluminum resistance